MIGFSCLNLTGMTSPLTNHSQAPNDFKGVLHLGIGLARFGPTGIPGFQAASVKHAPLYVHRREMMEMEEAWRNCVKSIVETLEARLIEEGQCNLGSFYNPDHKILLQLAAAIEETNKRLDALEPKE